MLLLFFYFILLFFFLFFMGRVGGCPTSRDPFQVFLCKDVTMVGTEPPYTTCTIKVENIHSRFM